MDIRLVKEEEMGQANYVWSQAFRQGSRSESDWIDTTHGGSFTCGVWEEAGLQAVTVVNDYRVHLGTDVAIPMGGIGGVACLPTSRGKGYAGACLKFSLAEMRERGIFISTLFPFSWDYYRRFGWEWMGQKRSYKAPAGILRADPGTENVRTYRPEDRDTVIAVYTNYAKRYRGALLRTERAWSEILEDTKDRYTYTYLYEEDGKTEGYLTYRGGEEKETSLREFIALNSRAQRALLGLLRRHEMQTEKFAWNAPENDALWSQFYHWDIETMLEPVTQGRVVDVKGALETWKPTRDIKGSMTLQVFDEAADWNTRTWRINCEGRETMVQPTDAAPQVSLDIQALSQAYFGTPNLDALRAADRLTAYNEGGYALLRAFLDGPPMWMNDSF